MKKQMDPSRNLFNTSLKVLAVIFTTAFLLSLLDGISALWSMGTLGLLTGPITFTWWPYFKNEMGMQPLLGIIPIVLIILGIRFRNKQGVWFLGYIGGVLWVVCGFIYVITHIV